MNPRENGENSRERLVAGEMKTNISRQNRRTNSIVEILSFEMSGRGACKAPSNNLGLISSSGC